MLGRRTLNFDDILGILGRRWAMLLIPATLGAIAGLVSSRVVPPQYLSQALVLIEQQKVPDNYVKPVVSTDLDARLATMREEILSRSRLLPIIDRYNLYAGRGQTMDARIETVRNKILIKPIHSEMSHGGGLPGFFISFTANDRQTAQLVCREITSLFVAENLRDREAAAEGTTDFIDDQLKAAKTTLDEQDKRMADFQRRFGGELPQNVGSNLNMLAGFNSELQSATEALSRLEQDRSSEEAVLTQQLQAAGRDTTEQKRDGSSGAREAKESELRGLLMQEQTLRREYTPSHPDVVALEQNITALRKDLAASALPVNSGGTHSQGESNAVQQTKAQLHATDLAKDAKRRERLEIEANIRLYQSRVSAAPGIEEEYKVMSRDYDTAESFYKSLLEKRNQSKMAGDLEKRQQGEQFTVLDPANLPDSPSFPKPAFFVGCGVASGIVMGVLFVGWREHNTTVIRADKDIRVLTEAPILGRLELVPGLSLPPKVTSVVVFGNMEGRGWIRRIDA